MEVKNSAPKQAENLLAAHKIFIHSGRRWEAAGTAAGRIFFMNPKVRKSNKGSVKHEQNIQGHLQQNKAYLCGGIGTGKEPQPEQKWGG